MLKKWTPNKIVYSLGVIQFLFALFMLPVYHTAWNYLWNTWQVIGLHTLILLAMKFDEKARSKYTAAAAYAFAAIAVTQWMSVDSFHGESPVSFTLWIPVGVFIFTAMKRISTKYLTHILIGYWTMIACYLLIHFEWTMLETIKMAVGFPGAHYALSHYWVLIAALIIFTIYNKNKAKQRTDVRPERQTPRNQEPPVPTVYQRKPQNRNDLDKQ
jgi:hypothetical protein